MSDDNWDVLYRIPNVYGKVKVWDILKKSHPSSVEQFWLPRFLMDVGYTVKQVFDIVHNHNKWLHYNRGVALRFIRCVSREVVS